MKSELGLENIARNITKDISSTLDRTGIMYRIFYRVKTSSSIRKKIQLKNYAFKNEKLTDLIGIRVTLYFADDVSLILDKLKSEPNFDHLSVDEIKVDEFKPIRCNLVFNFSKNDINNVSNIIDDDSNLIDTKYEIQLRTVLSEGWHEVEHDLRYKCKTDWEDHNDLTRNLNGILATLETSEFSMLQLFQELAHRHYKNNKIEALIKSQFRIRFINTELTKELSDYLIKNSAVVKKIHRTSREKVLKELMNSKFSLPLTIDNFIYIINYLFINDAEVTKIAGEFIISEIEASFTQINESIQN